MSKQIGLIRLKGNIGGISLYQSGGQDLARMANGPSKERIASEPNFRRTRENNIEFGGAATVGKALRLSLAAALQTMGEPRLAAKLTALFKEMNLHGPGARGQRAITPSTNAFMLTNFDFNSKTPLSSVFNAPFSVSNNAARDQGDITVPNFSPDSFIEAPQGATHFRILQALGVVSDYVFDPNTNRYEPLEPALNMIGDVTYSTTEALGATPVTFALTTSLPGTPTMTADASVVQCLGIEFFQRVGTVDYILAQGNAMKVVKVF